MSFRLSGPSTVIAVFIRLVSACLLLLFGLYTGAACEESRSTNEPTSGPRSEARGTGETEFANLRLEIVTATTYGRALAIAGRLKVLLGRPVYTVKKGGGWKIQTGGFTGLQDIGEAVDKLKEIGITGAGCIDIRTGSPPRSGRITQFVESAFTGAGEEAVRVFLDMSYRYHDYIKKEVPFVSYVRDRKQADVFIMMTTQGTGSGGTEYTLTFFGQHMFASKNDTLHYHSGNNDSDETRRRGIVRTLKMGLVQYVSKTPQADMISVDFRKSREERRGGSAVRDKWNYWVFSLSLSGYHEGEESRKSISLNTNLSADRVTKDWKIGLGMYANYNERKYKTEDENILSITKTRRFRGLVVKSISDHWSAGIYGSAYSSVYSNVELSLSGEPAIEYNVFDYEDATRRQFRFLYRTGHTNVRYNEETIYLKTKEKLFEQSLSVTFEIREPWGSERFSIEGSHYFHDIEKYRVGMFNDLELRLFEGLSLNMWGSISKINDQLSLPREGASEEEILLHRRQLATQYDYYISVGLRYTFGSIYSNIVNPRFGRSMSGRY